MKNSDEAMKVTIIFYVKNKIAIDVIRHLIIKYQYFGDDWPISVSRRHMILYWCHITVVYYTNTMTFASKSCLFWKM